MRPLTFLLTGLAACASGGSGTNPDASTQHTDAAMPDGCGDKCDQDHDGVYDGMDKCPNSSSLSTVNHDGCADSQLTPTLQPFPPFGLTWTPTGDIGKTGGLTWTYVGIERGDLFHIWWIICDDPATPCGLSLDGPIDVAAENWTFSASGSDMTNGKIVL